MEIHVLKAQGHSEREIARRLGISRNTVARYVSCPDAPRYSAREPRLTKLSAFEDYIVRRIGEAAPDWICAPAMLREIRELGYTGGLRQLQGFMGQHKERSAPEPVVRFETKPGQQLQADFVTFRRGRDPLYAFTATLGYSRYRWLHFVTDERLETLIDCHHRLFSHLGGVPIEVLYDNPKTIVLQRDAYGEGKHRFNPGLLDVAKHYGFRIRLCRPYRAQTKGKVERFHRYLRQNFHVPLNSRLRAAGLRLDVATANAEVGRWLQDVANARPHEALDMCPAQAFDQTERRTLQSLPRFAVPRAERPAPKATMADRLPAHLPVHETLQHPLSTYQKLLTQVAA